MPRFLFSFGFETPKQLTNNDDYGWDDENSEGVLIEADTEANAQAWGEEIAERFISLLFNDPSVSWKKRRYASWTETPDPEVEYPLVKHGEYPDFVPWIERAKD